MCAHHGAGIGEIPFDEEHPEGKRVGETAQEKFQLSFPDGKVLVQEEKIVPEIKICLAGIALGKRCPAQMIYF